MVKITIQVDLDIKDSIDKAHELLDKLSDDAEMIDDAEYTEGEDDEYDNTLNSEEEPELEEEPEIKKVEKVISKIKPKREEIEEELDELEEEFDEVEDEKPTKKIIQKKRI